MAELRIVKDKVSSLEICTKNIESWMHKLVVGRASSEVPTFAQRTSETAAGEQEEGLVDSVYCRLYEKLSFACQCKRPAFEQAECVLEECGYTVPHFKLRLADLERMLARGAAPEDFDANFPCPSCEGNTIRISLSTIRCSDRVCEECCGVADQENK